MKDAFYFSHDSNARHDPKITAMRSVYGSEGYGWFWMFVEMMRESENYKLDMQSKYVFNSYAMQLQCERIAIEQFVQDCIHEFDLFKSDEAFFWSESLLKRMEIKDIKSKKARESANARWNKSEGNANALEDDANASKTDAYKESKVKESKVNKKEDINTSGTKVPVVKKFIQPTLEEVSNYCYERGNRVDPENWIDHYTSNGWKVGKNPMKDWKAAVRTWEKNAPKKPYTTKADETKRQLDLLNLDSREGELIGTTDERTGSKEIIELDKDSFSIF